MGNPLYNENRIKLGVMAFNCSHGSTVTKADNSWRMTWEENKQLAQLIDASGMEVLLPVGRWKGYGGETNFNNRTFESFTWASGIGAVTRHCTVFATIHAPLIHPVAAAKMAATADHISNGRFAINVVAGWFKNEFEMFNTKWRDHKNRYNYLEEWTHLLKRLWQEEDAFDFDGDFFQGRSVWSQPKPLQKPYPPIMNAGSSSQGQLFSAKHANMNFVMLKQKDRDSDVAQINHLKKLALDANRSSQCWIHGYVVCRETEEEATEYLKHYVVDKGDNIAVTNMLDIFGIESQTLDDSVLNEFKFHFKAGHGGYPLVGTPDQIVSKIQDLSSMGVDGILLSWVDYIEEAQYWIKNVLPRLEQAGLRDPFTPGFS